MTKRHTEAFLLILFVPVDGRRRVEALWEALLELVEVCLQHVLERHVQRRRRLGEVPRHVDRKSTRLNSSH